MFISDVVKLCVELNLVIFDMVLVTGHPFTHHHSAVARETLVGNVRAAKWPGTLHVCSWMKINSYAAACRCELFMLHRAKLKLVSLVCQYSF